MIKRVITLIALCSFLVSGAFGRGPAGAARKRPEEKHAEGREMNPMMNRAANPATGQGLNVFKQVEQSEQQAMTIENTTMNAEMSEQAARQQSATQAMNQGIQQANELTEQLRQSSQTIGSEMQQDVSAVRD